LPLVVATPAAASTGLDGQSLSLVWAVPFAGMLASIALGPRFAAQFWDPHYGKAAAFWAALTVVPLAVVLGLRSAGEALFGVLALDYLPFILMLFALYTAAGGLHIGGRHRGTPAANTMLLAIGAVAANLIGSIGAAMVLIRPLLRANADRRGSAHVMIFFIFIVGNIGGALSPLGNPPLFLGFLHGVGFFWFVEHLWLPTLLSLALLLGLFYLLDAYQFRREEREAQPASPQPLLRISGGINLLLIGIAIAAIIMSALWHPAISLDVLGTRLELQNLLRDALMLAVGLASLHLTKHATRAANGFEWHPLIEVAALFAGIFVTIVPVMAMLEAGSAGPFHPLVALVSHPDGSPNNAAYFWLTGLLSSFLDNAPTYLVFFEIAGGNAVHLMDTVPTTLAAISLGAAYMGAVTYIGNAPNFMIYAISRHAGVKMPGFFAYLLWSGSILLPLFALLTIVFFR
jgi:Na+/H+ antiporter NhaD/arsenite permease-like protein